MNLPRPVDACPNCLTSDGAVLVTPHTVWPDGDGQRIWANYECPTCAHMWWVSWLLSALTGTEAA